MNTLLRLTNITKAFGAIRALKGVSFELNAGEVHALVGENGAGKSTLIKIITGAYQPDGGTIEIDGAPAPQLTPASAHAFGIAAIYQQPALFPQLSVAENIGLALEKPEAMRLVNWKHRQQRAHELLERVGARIHPEAEVSELSMPEQQLVEIARALGAGARILVMDEPTASITDREVDLVFELVRKLRAGGTGIIYISHRLQEIFQIGDRVTVLRDGESVATKDLSRASTHRGTAGGMTEMELIHLMIGREMSAMFPPAENRPGAPLFAVENLCCEAAGIERVSFSVRSGEIFGLAGLVGAGRTELARVLFGITPADSGTIAIGGNAIEIRSPSQALKAGIAYVPEDRRRHGVILELPVAANISLGVLARLFPRAWLSASAEKELSHKFIQDLSIKTPSSEVPVGNLSGGNQQKVALARWLAAKPKVLILDEPTQGVDVGAKGEIHGLIRRLAAEGMVVLMISSELPEIMGMSDRIGVMREGRLEGIFEAPVQAHEVMAAALGQKHRTGLDRS